MKHIGVVASVLVAAGMTVAANADEKAKPVALVKYEVVDGKNGKAINKSLTGKPGDAKQGRAVAIDRKKGNCLACHKMPIPEQQFHGTIGPDLKGVASRYTEGELRMRVVNPKVTNEATIMPAFYRAEGFHRVLKEFEGKSILTADEVEDVIAYLMTLQETEPSSFNDAFSAARKSGMKMFTWQGRKYTTEMKQ